VQAKKTFGMFLFCLLPLTSAQATITLPKYSQENDRLALNHEYFRQNPAADFWALIPYYVPERNNASCSLATAVMVVNAARAEQTLHAADGLATQKDLLAKLKNKTMEQKLSDTGHGIDLEGLAKLVQSSFDIYGIKGARVTVVHVDQNEKETQKKIHRALIENEKSARNFMLVNYLQSTFTGDPEGAVGQIAPVGAYDEKKKRVLILDPDRDWYEPYWVSEETLVAGMNTKNADVNQNRGYVWVELPALK
jgi:hypothetical protein